MGDLVSNFSCLKEFITCSEAGKSSVAIILRSTTEAIEKVMVVSVLSRDRGYSFTDFVRYEDDHYLIQTRAKLLDSLRVLCAARVVEQILLQNSSKISSVDMATSYRKAHQMIYLFGLSDVGLSHCVLSKNKWKS